MESSLIESSVSPVPLAYATPELQRRWPFRVLTISIIGLLVVLVIFVLLPAVNPPHSQAPRVKCSSNMRQIGLAMIMYANQHNGKFPDSLHEILETQDITPGVFVCPSSNEVRAMGATARAELDDFDRPGRCSYIYLGKGLTDQCDFGTAVLYEPPSIHHGGMNVLFADGHVEFFGGPNAQSILKSIANRQPIALK